MIENLKKLALKWSIAALALTLIGGCSGLSNPISPISNNQSQGDTSNSQEAVNIDQPDLNAITQQHPDAAESLLSEMMAYGEQGKVIYSDFSAKTNTIDDVEKVWGKADKTDYVAAAKGRYATYSSHNIVFGINKGNQIFEVRSFDNRLKGITLETTKKVLGTPAYDVKDNGQEIIGYTTGSDFKVEMVFTQPAASNSNPVMHHYNVLYPQGTVNGMADDPGRQW